jgi:hypothetical protein
MTGKSAVALFLQISKGRKGPHKSQTELVIRDLAAGGISNVTLANLAASCPPVPKMRCYSISAAPELQVPHPGLPFLTKQPVQPSPPITTSGQ